MESRYNLQNLTVQLGEQVPAPSCSEREIMGLACQTQEGCLTRQGGMRGDLLVMRGKPGLQARKERAPTPTSPSPHPSIWQQHR